MKKRKLEGENMRKKNKLLVGLLLIMALLFVACGKEEVPEQESEIQEEVVEEQAEEEKEESSVELEDATPEEEEVIVEEPEVEEPQIDWLSAVSVWTTEELNLRAEPNTECDIITVFELGTELKKATEEDGWAYVKCGDHEGYVSTKYLANEKPEEKPVEEPEEKPASQKVEAIPGQHRDPNSIVVVIDPGHQGKGDSTKEPNGPDSSTMKARVTSGATGVASGVSEYKLVLEVSLLLRDELENRGYTVYMTRSSHDVNISNMERAQYASSVGADIAVRIHADSVDKESVRGATVLVPSADNAYVSHLAKASKSLGNKIISAYCDATGFKNRGVSGNDTMTGINWSEVPVAILELGFMSNPTEDMAMQDEAMQNNMVQGIANGIDDYFGL